MLQSTARCGGRRNSSSLGLVASDTSGLPSAIEQAQFACSYKRCGAVFRRKQSLKRHEDAIHLNLRYVCDVDGCGKVFRYDQSLLLHKKVVHKAAAV